MTIPTPDELTVKYEQAVDLSKELLIQLKTLERFKGIVNAKTIAVRKDLNIINAYIYCYKQFTTSGSGGYGGGGKGVVWASVAHFYIKASNIINKKVISLL